MQASLNSLELLDGQPAIPDPAEDVVATIMLAERNDVMCTSCLSALAQASAGECVVAVVGESHLAGISARLQGSTGISDQQYSSLSQQSDSAEGPVNSDEGSQQVLSVLDVTSKGRSNHQHGDTAASSTTQASVNGELVRMICLSLCLMFKTDIPVLLSAINPIALWWWSS